MRDGRINVEPWYFEINFENMYLQLAHGTFLKSKRRIT